MKKAVKNLTLAKETLHTLAKAEGGAIGPTAPVTINPNTFGTCRLCEDTWLTV